MGKASARQVVAIVALLVVLCGFFQQALSAPTTPVVAHQIRQHRVSRQIRILRARSQRTGAKIRHLRTRFGQIDARRGSRSSRVAESAGAHAGVVGAHTRTSLRHLRRRLHRKIESLRRRQRTLQSWFGTIGILRRCPVEGWTSRSDNFGYMVRIPGVPMHLHHGIDIMASTGSPIVAPFDGVARSGSGVLGGNTVIVTGTAGWVYNAHLSSFSVHSNGKVHAGDVIGYVGSTGDARGPHDHFEFHPNQIPSGWPASPFGYSSIGTAIDPSLLLDAACG